MKTVRTPQPERGFTLVELLVSMAFLSLLLFVLVAITDTTRRTWSYTRANVEEFRDAREACESISRKLSQATLNPYWDYDDPNAPTKYQRQSELRFISGQAPQVLSGITNSGEINTHCVFFQAPLGYVADSDYSNLDNLLNTWGYFIEFSDDSQSRPPFITAQTAPYRWRFRLMEMLEPSDSLTLYQYTSGAGSASAPKNRSYVTNPPLQGLQQPTVNPAPSGTGREWFTTPLRAANRPVRVVADNIVALVLLPKLTPQEDASGTSLAPGYNYDSTAVNADPAINPKNQIPPVVQLTIVAVDEVSFNRFIPATSSQTAPAIPDFCKDTNGTPLFQQAGDLANSKNPGYARDLETLQSNLKAKKINYRVFTTTVSMKAAKWSRAQKN